MIKFALERAVRFQVRKGLTTMYRLTSTLLGAALALAAATAAHPNPMMFGGGFPDQQGPHYLEVTWTPEVCSQSQVDGVWKPGGPADGNWNVRIVGEKGSDEYLDMDTALRAIKSYCENV